VAYRRAAYERHVPGRGVPGPVADEVLVQRLAAADPGSVRFCAASEALVETDPVLEIRAFWAQRRRWAGTGPRYPQRGLAATILGVYAFYVLLLASLLSLPFTPGVWPGIAVALGLKLGSEAAILYPACRHLGQRRLLRYFVPEQLVQIPYVVFVGLAAVLSPPRWKGRRTSA
jgi:hypothetical protein